MSAIGNSTSSIIFVLTFLSFILSFFLLLSGHTSPVQMISHYPSNVDSCKVNELVNVPFGFSILTWCREKDSSAAELLFLFHVLQLSWWKSLQLYNYLFIYIVIYIYIEHYLIYTTNAGFELAAGYLLLSSKLSVAHLIFIFFVSLYFWFFFWYIFIAQWPL